MSDYRTYLKTLRRLPDEVILSMATRPIDLANAYECVCGWGARELRVCREGAGGERPDFFVTGYLAAHLGDEDNGWCRVNGASPGSATGDALEEAFVDRVLECVG